MPVQPLLNHILVWARRQELHLRGNTSRDEGHATTQAWFKRSWTDRISLPQPTIGSLSCCISERSQENTSVSLRIAPSLTLRSRMKKAVPHCDLSSFQDRRATRRATCSTTNRPPIQRCGFSPRQHAPIETRDAGITLRFSSTADETSRIVRQSTLN